MDRIFQEMTAGIPDHAPLQEALFAFGSGMLRSALSDAQIALLRVVSMETVRFPQLGQRFFDLGPGRGIAALATYLRGQIDKGVLRREDPTMMAQHYLGMIAGPPLIFSLLGVRARPKGNRKQSTRLEKAIEVFERAYLA
ncbi:MAG TPA: TetR/AcrR family transcriptional regulator C-terminal domain-containing protein [Terriglobia bacterium]|nr:TetR/AcrR family transcriptional regulator C-terminal domain-containing protein [Terriglobia bacterium]